jgi:hypothetical protein
VSQLLEALRLRQPLPAWCPAIPVPAKPWPVPEYGTESRAVWPAGIPGLDPALPETKLLQAMQGMSA